MRKRTGDILVEKGLLTPSQIQDAFKYSQAHGIRIGDACLKLGFLKPQALEKIFGSGNQEDFFYLDVNYYPAVTADLFPVETLIQYGALPLGFKTDLKFFSSKKLLNIGLLNPGRQEIILPELKTLALQKLGHNAFQEFKVYLIIAEQFLEVLEKKYNYSPEKLSNSKIEMEERLSLYLNNGA